MNYQLRFATFISRIFDPFLVMLAVTLLAVRLSTLSFAMQVYFFLGTMFLMVGIPVGLVVVFIKKKWITNWDMSVRSERPKALLALFIIEVMSMLILRHFADRSLVAFFALFIAWLVGFMLITLFWKISGHSGVSAFATGYLLTRLGMGYWPLLLIVPLVGWSRVVRRNHTVNQVIVGALYPWILIILSGAMFHVS